MNCIDLFRIYSTEFPERPALWMPDHTVISFGQLQQAATSAQNLLRRLKIMPGDGILLFDKLNPRLYAAIIGILGLGAHVILVEPWMPLPLINRAISLVRPQLFLTSLVGRMWGMRAAAIRKIPTWHSVNEIRDGITLTDLHVETVSSTSPGIITFTSGTTGQAKGVVRTQGMLLEQHFAVTEALQSGNYAGPDLCVFANLALSNLALGRCSLLMPSDWGNRYFRLLQQLPHHLAPETLSCGPAFLSQLLAKAPLPSLQSINVGGAVTDCALFEKGFSRLPDVKWKHIYGSSEAEPVTACDARTAVLESRKNGYFQTLYLGDFVPQIQAEKRENSLWVTGPHVSTYYLGDEESNSRYKKVDDAGRVWHDMGDRVIDLEKKWWYGGRSSQSYEEFILEQKIYDFLQSSACFVARGIDGLLYLLGENVHRHRRPLLQHFSMISDVFEIVIWRDRRHRARIDRKLSIQKGAPWIVG